MYELDKQKFGAFVAALRKEKGMTQRQLAERLYISDKAVSKWEYRAFESFALIKGTALIGNRFCQKASKQICLLALAQSIDTISIMQNVLP